jgi:hypothetical protein
VSLSIAVVQQPQAPPQHPPDCGVAGRPEGRPLAEVRPVKATVDSNFTVSS